jgi:uncharacterized protein (DUF427 family)
VPRAVWSGLVVAESDTTEVLDGYYYFPPQSVRREYLRESSTKSVCPWKGVAEYYHLEAPGGEVSSDAAWCYPETKAAAYNIQGFIAFWKGVEVED